MKSNRRMLSVFAAPLVALAQMSNCMATDNAPANAPSAASGTVTSQQTVLPKADSPAEIVTESACSKTVIAGHRENPLVLVLLAPVLEKIASAVVSYGYDAVTTWLKDRPMDYLASTTATKSLQFYQPGAQNLAFNCIEIVRGDLHEANFDTTTYSKNLNGKVASPGWEEATLKSPAQWLTWRLSSQPELYLAFRISTLSVVAPGTGKQIALYFKIQPLEILYLKSGAKNNKSGSKQVVVELKITSPSGSVVYDHAYDLGMLEVGKSYNLDYLDGPYAALPVASSIGTITAPTEQGIQTEGNQQKSHTETLDKPTKAQDKVTLNDAAPVGITATITESEIGGDFARALGTSLADTDTKNAVVKSTTTSLDKLLGVTPASGTATAQAAQKK